MEYHALHKTELAGGQAPDGYLLHMQEKKQRGT